MARNSTVSSLVSRMQRAHTLRELEPEAIRTAWWDGCVRGLRYADCAEAYRLEAEHVLWVDAAESPDTYCAALGRGYRTGLTLDSAIASREIPPVQA